jgi:hypothetical protein
MTDQTAAGLSESEVRAQRALIAQELLAARRLRPATIWAITGAAAVVLLGHFCLYEGLPANILFTAATTAGIAAAVVLATRRVLVATAVTFGLVALIVGISRAKLETVGMVLHAYDFIFYLGSWSTVTYLWHGAQMYVLALGGALLLFGLAVWLAWRFDSTRIYRRHAAAAIAVSVSLALAGSQAKGDRPHTLFYWEALYVSSFFSSWSETLETLWRGQIVEASPLSSGRPFATPTSCHPLKKPPHIVLIHQESIVQPSLFPSLGHDRKLDDFFTSADGKLHRMRVETYGGASWLTEFSILAGMSTQSFGGMRHFVQSILAGKVRETVPEVLARCGYRNVLFYPMLKNFVSNARFYETIGLREIFDLRTQKARGVHERDRFYYTNALDEMERHIRTQDKPLFTYIQTMSAHWPYSEPFHPEINVAGGGPGTHPEMHEYLRRVGIAKMDYDYLKSELKRRFPDEPILIMHYGDHHPMATRMLLGYGENNEVEDIHLGMGSLGMITYYVVDALNYKLSTLPQHDTLDVAYLGAVLLEQAGIPLPEAWRERLRLMAACEGRYYDCKRRSDILAFHRRLLDSGQMEAR